MRGTLVSLSPTTLNVGVNFGVTSQIFGCPQIVGIKKGKKNIINGCLRHLNKMILASPWYDLGGLLDHKTIWE